MRNGDRYDEVYCVFDRDEHERFDTARSKVKNWRLIPITSWPCFEYWILLHFGYTRKPYTHAGEKTPSQNCLSDLKEKFPGYQKNAGGLFSELGDKIEVAKIHSKTALKEAIETKNFNPSTEFHTLIEYLQSLAREN